MIPAEDEIVIGEVFKVNAEAVKQMDLLEGVPRLYKRKDFTVRMHKGPRKKVQSYLWNGTGDYPAAGSEWLRADMYSWRA